MSADETRPLTGANLREIADWIDATDHIVSQYIEQPLGGGVQADMRRWADDVDAAPLARLRFRWRWLIRR